MRLIRSRPSYRGAIEIYCYCSLEVTTTDDGGSTTTDVTAKTDESAEPFAADSSSSIISFRRPCSRPVVLDSPNGIETRPTLAPEPASDRRGRRRRLETPLYADDFALYSLDGDSTFDYGGITTRCGDSFLSDRVHVHVHVRPTTPFLGRQSETATDRRNCNDPDCWRNNNSVDVVRHPRQFGAGVFSLVGHPAAVDAGPSRPDRAVDRTRRGLVRPIPGVESSRHLGRRRRRRSVPAG